MKNTETLHAALINPGLLSQFSNGILKQAKQLLVPALLCITPSQQAFAQYTSGAQYIKHFAPLAKKLSIQTGIPASVILGVALIESGHGSSKNCILLKNHFGIVGKNKLAMYASPYQSIYKGYASDEASFEDFCRVIKSKKYYGALKGNNNFLLWLQTINSGYYSSAGTIWIKHISEAIASHQLYRLDGHVNGSIMAIH